MKRHDNILPAALTALVATLGVVAQNAEAAEIPFGEARLFFELNNTDEDLGIHALIDGDAWKLLEIEDPYERTILDVMPSGRLAPGHDRAVLRERRTDLRRIPPAAFFPALPRRPLRDLGRHARKRGTGKHGAVLSHVLPGPPANVRVSGIPAATNCDAVLPGVSPPVVITWNAVNTLASGRQAGRRTRGEIPGLRRTASPRRSDVQHGSAAGQRRFVVPAELLRQGATSSSRSWSRDAT